MMMRNTTFDDDEDVANSWSFVCLKFQMENCDSRGHHEDISWLWDWEQNVGLLCKPVQNQHVVAVVLCLARTLHLHLHDRN